jgi:DNA polymerase III subunit epsilon
LSLSVVAQLATRSTLRPERSVPADALAAHGLPDEFLADKPLFGPVADEFLTFVGDAPLVANNARFDTAFLNAELKRAAKPTIATERIIDCQHAKRSPSTG